MFVTQKHWDERSVPVQEMVGEFFMKTGGIKEAGAGIRAAADLRPWQYRGLRSLSAEQRRGRRGKTRCRACTGIMGRHRRATGAGRRANAVASCVTAARISMSIARKPRRWAFRSTPRSTRCAATLGTYYVNDFNKYGRTWQVLMSAGQQYRKRPEDIGRIFVRSDRGAMVPVVGVRQDRVLGRSG